MSLPPEITQPNPLVADLTSADDLHQWALVIKQTGGSLGVGAPNWLNVRNQIVRYLADGESVNIISKRQFGFRIINCMIDDIQSHYIHELVCIDALKGTAATRRGLIAEIIKSFGSTLSLLEETDDLAAFDRFILSKEKSYIAFLNFDSLFFRAQQSDHQIDNFDFISALYYLTMNKGKIVLLAQSFEPFLSMVPSDYPLYIPDFKTVELR